MKNLIKRTMGKQEIWHKIKNYCRCSDKWKSVKTVCVVNGLAGCGKTTLLLDYFRQRKHFYFSFAGLEESFAERLFVKKISALTGKDILNWDDAFLAVSEVYHFIIFDDIAPALSYKRFCKSFYEHMNRDICSRPLVFIVAEPTDDLSALADKHDVVNVEYFGIPDVINLFPKLSKFEILGVSAISGCIPKILNEYDHQISLEDNLQQMFNTSSVFYEFMPYLMDKYFRKPEIYHYILYAIANGNHSVSEIGKFTGFAYNKCNNYLSSLIANRLVIAEKETSKSGAEKTVYRLTNFYFKLWYVYIFKNRTALQLGDEKLKASIIKNIINKEIHEFHLQKAFALANRRIPRDLWVTFGITDEFAYAPQTVKKGNFSYTFDAVVRKKEKAVFIKVFESPLENCGRNEIDKIEKAVMLTNKYFDSHIYIFSKRRFSDYAVAEAAKDKTIKLVEVDRLKY